MGTPKGTHPVARYYCTTTKKKCGGGNGHAQNILPVKKGPTRIRNGISPPKYSSFKMPIFTDSPSGKLKSTITRRSLESFWGTEFKGDRAI
jgi:hypothetical protein